MRFRPDVKSVAAARHFIRGVLFNWDRTPEVELVVLLTSEVVTNVVVHAGPHDPGQEIEVGVRRTLDRVTVEVTDCNPGMPQLGDGGIDKPSGRGIMLLDTLASAWGVVPLGPGKVVWFEVQG